jgi:S-adenosylmethionine:tRNA ribosyltransferase-isomerase
MLRPGKRARCGTDILLRDHGGHATGIRATVSATNPEGHRRLRFSGTQDIRNELEALGEVPLPPYIVRQNLDTLEADRERYQTVFAAEAGSVAAPTAGLHFTPALLDAIRARGVEVQFVTLHVGPGTFAPVKSESLTTHTMHEERYEIRNAAAQAINAAKAAGRRVFAVGTTSLRVLESAATAGDARVAARRGWTGLFIYPPFQFRIVDALLTNFHLPCSTLLMLVSAFAAPGETHGREVTLRAYREAIRERYRFFSYGDAMLVL